MIANRPPLSANILLAYVGAPEFFLRQNDSLMFEHYTN